MDATGIATTSALRLVLALAHVREVNRAKLRTLLAALRDERDPSSAFLVDFVNREGRNIGIPAQDAGSLAAAWEHGSRAWDECERLQLHVLPFGWTEYPAPLLRLDDPPALLFVRGTADWTRRPRITVIGTRHASEWGLKTASLCAAQVGRPGGVVVSGLALGIDTAAHESALDSRGCTWAVLAHGLHTVAPSSNKKLAARIVEEGGALVSEYLPGKPPLRSSFVERDRIQAGLAEAVLVIETGIDGGSMHTVRAARAAKIPVLATFPDHGLDLANSSPERLPEVQRGTWALLRSGAARVRTPASLKEIVDSLSCSDIEPPVSPTFDERRLWAGQ